MSVCVEMSLAITSGVVLLLRQAVAEWVGLRELPVDTGGIHAFTLLQQLR